MLGERSFEVASDENLSAAIAGARQRLVLIAPAVSIAVATAIVDRLAERDPPDVQVVLDADAEVYRLGFGDPAALTLLREACATYHIGLQEQPGVRIGVLVADDLTIVYAPVPRMVEAGPTTVEKPNAVVIRGAAGADIAAAAGAGERDGPSSRQEIGRAAITPEKEKAVEASLKENPPQPFDIARSLRVFNSKVQYVELEVSNYRLSSRRLRLPPELLDIASDDLRKNISGTISTPFAAIERICMSVEKDGKIVEVEVDDQWIAKERKRIEDTYTYLVPTFGRVIFHEDRERFTEEVDRFTDLLQGYQRAAKAQIESARATFVAAIVDEFTPRWKENLPAQFLRWKAEFDEAKIRQELTRVATDLFDDAVQFQEPKVRKTPKSISPENVRDEAFINGIRHAMTRRGHPQFIIDQLFSSFSAAPASIDRRQAGSF